MADKNLHDIKIDELDSSKKSPIKNILTLLALLFIILVISVVITRLILNTDSDIAIENNNSQTEETKDLNKSIDLSSTNNGKKEQSDPETSAHENAANNNNGAKNESTTSTSTKIPLATHNVLERNLTSAIKAPLTSHVPKKDSSKKDVKEIKTYSEPRKNSDAKKEHTNNSKNATHDAKKTDAKNSDAKKSSTVKHTSSTTTHTPKKEYIDKVVTQKNPKHTSTTASTHRTASSTKSASYLGGKLKKVTHSYYIKVGTYRSPKTIIYKIKKSNFNYTTIPVENDKSLTRVLVGPFFSRNEAKAQLGKVKANILSGAYVTKVK